MQTVGLNANQVHLTKSVIVTSSILSQNKWSFCITTFWSLEQNLPNVVLHALSVKASSNFQKLCMDIMTKTENLENKQVDAAALCNL